jgi:hypothetical protein
MRKLVLAAVALVAMSLVTVPSALAQEVEKADAEKKMEQAKKMEKKAKEAHWMKGTMAAPDSEPVDIKYAFKKTEEGAKGWIVAEDDEGETVKMEMRDLSWGDDQVTYNWSPPDQDALVISCALTKQDDGGYGGNCMDNQEEGRTGQMTIAPMEKKEKSEG